MKKERFLPYWSDLKRVLAVLQSQTASDVTLTLVSVELYAVYGFLLTFNVQSSAPNALFDRSSRGWTRASIIDQLGNRYTSLLTTITGVSDRHMFRGRAVMACMPHVAERADALTIAIDDIEWDILDHDGSPPATKVLVGPWRFHVSL